MILSLALLIAAAVVIYLSCEYFVNGMEWAGLRLGVVRSAVGTVLAAFGTALPESVVTFVAVVFGKGPSKDIGPASPSAARWCSRPSPMPSSASPSSSPTSRR